MKHITTYTQFVKTLQRLRIPVEIIELLYDTYKNLVCLPHENYMLHEPDAGVTHYMGHNHTMTRKHKDIETRRHKNKRSTSIMVIF